MTNTILPPAGMPAPETAQPKTNPSEISLRPAALIVNAKARKGKEWFEQTRECLRSNGVELKDAQALEDPSHLDDMVKNHLKQGVKLLVIGGGDGTFRTVAGLLAHTDTTLGVLPLGTVNDFARNLGIEATVESACKVIAAGKTATVDMGMANKEPFLITASLGFSAQSQTALKPELKKLFGPFGYLIASLLALRQLCDLKVTVQHEGTEECVDALQVGVIKGHYWMGGKIVIPNVDLAVDKFAFYAVPARHRRSFLSMARHLRNGQFFNTPELRAFTTDDVTLTTTSPKPLVLDGDLCGQTPVRLRVVRNALRVCVAESFPEN